MAMYSFCLINVLFHVKAFRCTFLIRMCCSRTAGLPSRQQLFTSTTASPFNDIQAHHWFVVC